ncbi:RNA polymerase sigma factor, sigma-70 family [Actinacidiphila alni]|uniref:RNA polymerase sigma factor, sigma-70 family n=1 Tax=Actinacidiphila alni TaxID=380248 RepID=A0A1I2BUL6_9ACTN|nr:sigma-70 family RNA polymerase sigma factor [Actinacidiphila alni]SFE59685.1 RNA polymerase sigma factor, sigma-70 family [Actinacidiphila alni]
MAAVIALTGDWDLAEECAQDAFARALERWPADGVPRSPGAWLTTTARNRALDRVRRAANERRKLREVAVLAPVEAPTEPPDDGAVPDDRLRLIFTCCHPALPLPSRVALTLRTLTGLSTAQIARAFLVPEGTMGQRLTRAKSKIRHAGIPFRVPPRDQLPERTSAVLAVLYLLFNAGYAPTATERPEAAEQDPTSPGGQARTGPITPHATPPASGPDAPTGPNPTAPAGPRTHDRTDGTYGTNGTDADSGREQRRVAAEAIRLARLLVALLPDEPEARGLLALMLLHEARAAARTDAAGDLVPLDEQDRTAWDRDLIAEGLSMVEDALLARRPGPYQIQAAIAACHAGAATADATDWRQIALLYRELARMAPSPVVELNRAVAVSMAEGPAAALPLVDALAAGGELAGYHLLPATRADLLRRLGDRTGAAAAYREAIALAPTPAERRFLGRRLAEVGGTAAGRDR